MSYRKPEIAWNMQWFMHLIVFVDKNITYHVFLHGLYVVRVYGSNAVCVLHPIVSLSLSVSVVAQFHYSHRCIGFLFLSFLVTTILGQLQVSTFEAISYSSESERASARLCDLHCNSTTFCKILFIPAVQVQVNIHTHKHASHSSHRTQQHQI